jgi:hypothetical protein
MKPQAGEGLRASSVAVSGGSIQVNVGQNSGTVEVNSGGDATSSYPVPSNKTVTIPVPNVPPGTILTITVGAGLSQRIIYVEVVAPGP